MPFWRFTLFTLIGCIPWVLMLTLAGRAVGDNWEDLQKQLHYFDYALVVAIVGGVVWLVVRHRAAPRAGRGQASRRPRRGRGGGLTVDAEAMRRFAVERVEALFNRGELDRVEEFVTPDFVNHEAWPGEDPGYEGFRLRLRRLHEAISDLHMEVHEVLAEGDLVAYRATLSGTHTGRAARHPGDRDAPSASSTCTCCACATGWRASTGPRATTSGCSSSSGSSPGPAGPGSGSGGPSMRVEAPGVVEGLELVVPADRRLVDQDLGERVAPRQLDQPAARVDVVPAAGRPPRSRRPWP